MLIYSCLGKYRGECVFTIYPLTARDLDDALLEGLYRVAVRYFEKEDSTLTELHQST